jgi:hypothetical protein
MCGELPSRRSTLQTSHLLRGNVRCIRRHNSLTHGRWVGSRSNKNTYSGHVLMWKLKKIFHDRKCIYSFISLLSIYLIVFPFLVHLCLSPLSPFLLTFAFIPFYLVSYLCFLYNLSYLYPLILLLRTSNQNSHRETEISYASYGGRL